jgi:hypothetical protein
VSRRLALLVALCGLIATTAAGAGRPAASTAATSAAHPPATPPIRHVFVIVLENESASTTFGAASPAPYLARTLSAEGAYLPNYYGIGHESNDNYIAMISGQAPNPQNQADCQVFDDFIPGTIGADGQAQGTGCVYPSTVPTIGSQLTGAGLSWRDYNEDMGATPARESTVCGHPAVNGRDGTQSATAQDQYATRHNPFVYFHAIIDDTTLCDDNVVNLDELPQDLSRASATANYTFITPDLCDDGHDAPCADGEPGGLPQADKFLQTWVPQITGSPAFKQNGLLIVTFDEAATSDTSSCCGEIAGPGSPEPGINGPGGGRVGAVLLSPCIAPGTVSQTPYNHYSMLASVENLFGLSHIGYAGLPGEPYFGADIYTRSCSATSGGSATGSSRAPRRGCPRATGRLSGTTLGLVRLGFTRARARRAYAHSSDRGRRYEDFFCLTPTGVRVGYASSKLLALLSRHERARVRGRVVWASTASGFYSLRGIRPGASIAAARNVLRPGAPFHVGVNVWYFAPNGSSTALLKVRHGIVEEIGIADGALTGRRAAERAFVNSFS